MFKIETFENIAEVAATIVGFSALISIFQQKITNWNHQDRVNLIRFYAMIEQGTILLIFCYLPIIIINYLDSSATFRFTSGLWGFTAIAYSTFAFVRNKKITGIVNIAGISTKFLKFFAIAFIIFSFANAIGLLGKNYQSNYLVLSFFQLLLSLYFFLKLIYFTIKEPDKL